MHESLLQPSIDAVDHGVESGGGITVRVLLCGRTELLRMGVRAALDSESDIQVVAETAHGATVGELIRQVRPSVVVSESPMPAPAANGTGGEPLPARTVVVLSSGLALADVDHAVRSGVRGVVLHDDPSHRMIDAVRIVAAGQAFLSPAVTTFILDQLAARLPPPGRVVCHQAELLTRREREVLQLVSCGLTTNQVAKQIGRSAATVKSHISHVLIKLGLQDRTQAVAFAYQAGLVRPADTGAATLNGHGKLHQ